MENPRRLVARLAASIAAADGRVTPPELAALEHMDQLGYGPLAAVAMEELERIAEGSVDLAGTCAMVRARAPDAVPLVVTALAEIAASDDEIAPPELELLQGIATRLGLTAPETAHVLQTVLTAHRVGITAPSAPRNAAPNGVDGRHAAGPAPTALGHPRTNGGAMQAAHSHAPHEAVARACALLGVGAGADEADLTRAYRVLVERYDPAKVIDLGPEFARLAIRKLALMTDAYDVAMAALADDRDGDLTT